MKKAITIILMIIASIIIYLLQTNLFSWFTIAGVKPNLFVILILFIGLFSNSRVGIIYGILFGFFLDIVIGKNIGTTSVMLGLIGFLGGYLDKNFSKESKLTIILMVIGSTCIYEIGTYIFNIIRMSINIEIFTFIKILIIELIFNVILTIILYPLIKKAGYKIEEIFKGQNILTRYF